MIMMRKLTHQEIVDRQKVRMQAPPLRLTVVLDSIRSLYNVGAIFRTADGVGVEKIFLCGITGTPEQAAVRKTALGAQERVPWEYASDVVTVAKGLKQAGYQVVLLEQTDTAVNYNCFHSHKPVCLIVGNEIEGITSELITIADAAVEIEMAGIKNSLNAAVAFGIIAYHLRSGWLAGRCF